MSKRMLLGLATMFAAMSVNNPSDTTPDNEPQETDEERKARLAAAKIKINIANGLKEYVYGNKSLWALNQRNADRKARKLKWI